MIRRRVPTGLAGTSRARDGKARDPGRAAHGRPADDLSTAVRQATRATAAGSAADEGGYAGTVEYPAARAEPAARAPAQGGTPGAGTEGRGGNPALSRGNTKQRGQD